MPALPVYHSVPTDEKAPISPTESEYVHPASLGLRVGAPSALERAKDKYAGLSKMKKALVALAAVWFALVIAHKAAGLVGGHHHHHGRHHGQDFGMQQWGGEGFHGPPGGPESMHGPHGHGDHKPFDEELSPVVTSYSAVSVLATDEASKILSATASFPINLGRGNRFNLNFEGEGNVIITRADEDDEQSMVSVSVDSTWTSDEPEGVEMMSGERSHSLSVASSETSSHTVRIVLPADKKRLPSISISSTQSLNFDISAEAQDVMFKSLSLKSESGDINLPAVVAGRLEAETVSGSVGGTFNVSKAIVIKTVTGDIDATVNVVPLFPPPPHHKNGSHHGGPPPPHHKNGSHHGGPPPPPHRGGKEHGPEHKREIDESVEGPRFDMDFEHEDEHKSSWLSSLFNFKPKHGGHGGPPPPPPPPVFIGAFSTTGSVALKIHAPPFVSTETKAFSHTGDVDVVAQKPFHGFYEVGTFKGTYKVEERDGKEKKVLDEFVGEAGGKQKGLVFPEHKGKNLTEEVTEMNVAKRSFDGEAEDFEVQVEDFEDFEDEQPAPEGLEGPGGPPKGPGGPPPPGKGPKGPGGPPPPGKGPKGPGGPPPPGKGPKGPGGPPPPGKGPKGPGGPPPGKGPKGPGGPPPPPPPPGKGPGKGPGGPGGPPPPPPPPPGKGPGKGKGPGGPPPPPPPPGKGPKGPGGPGGPAPPPGHPHGPPPPPGHSKVFAHTDVGSVQVVL